MKRAALHALLPLAAASVIGAGCKQSRPPPQAALDAGEVAPPPLAPATVAAPRCALVDGASARLTEGAERVEIGEAIPRENGVALGVVRSGAAGARAMIALVDVSATSLAPVRFLSSSAAPVSPDSAPPKPLLRGDAVSALDVVHTRADGGPQRATSLVLAALADGKPPAALATIAARGDEPLADGVASPAGALVAWEEDAVDRGVVVSALAAPSDPQRDAKGGDAKGRVISSDASDADSPRVASRPGGFWVAWLARRPDSAASPDEHRVEAPAERRTPQWIEIVALDDHGAPLAPARALTGNAGHIGGFDLATRPSGELDVFARDDEQPSEGAGGRILRITLHGDTVDPTVVVVADGVGRGALDVVSGGTAASGESWLAFADIADHTRLVPLTDARAPLGPPSVEPALDGARLLTVAAGGKASTLLAAFPSEDAQLRLLRCAR